MNIVELAEAIEKNYYFERHENIILQFSEDDNDFALIIKKSNGFIIAGTATWGDYDDWAFDNPNVYNSVYEALVAKEDYILETAGEIYDADEEHLSYVYEPIEGYNTRHILIVKPKSTLMQTE